MSQSKVVILYDWLHHKSGGGERMLFEILELYPAADLICLTYNKAEFGDKIGSRRVLTSGLQYLPNWIKNRPALLLPLIRQSVKKLPSKQYDQVIAVSSAWVKNVDLRPHQRGIVYCFSPARMLWDSWPQALFGRTSNPIIRFIVTIIASRLRLWDYFQSQQSSWQFVAISETIQRRIAKFYHRTSKIIYPVVDVPATPALPKSDNYIIVSVLANYKQIDLAIKACLKLKRRLVIVGDGPARDSLQKLAANSNLIEFTGRVNETDKIRLLAAARGFIFCSIEDFGIAPLEALACGTPVVALRGGGLSETIPESSCGVFYDHPTVRSLTEAILVSEKKHWQSRKMRTIAQQYNRSNFRKSWQNMTQSMSKSSSKNNNPQKTTK